jgi:hypothetical protein
MCIHTFTNENGPQKVSSLLLKIIVFLLPSNPIFSMSMLFVPLFINSGLNQESTILCNYFVAFLELIDPICGRLTKKVTAYYS